MQSAAALFAGKVRCPFAIGELTAREPACGQSLLEWIQVLDGDRLEEVRRPLTVTMRACHVVRVAADAISCSGFVLCQQKDREGRNVRIGGLVELSGVSQRSLRYYEE